MRTYDKRVIKQANRPLNEASTVKNWRDTSFVSLAILKKEGDSRFLYPIPTRNFNNLDYDKGQKVMKNESAGPLKIASFLYTTDAYAAVNTLLGDGSGLLVLINYFDFDITPTINKFNNTSKKEDRNNPANYVSDSATHNTDKSCIVIGVVRSNYSW